MQTRFSLAALFAASLCMVGIMVSRSRSVAQAPENNPPAKARPGGFPDLAGALKATPGCLGVETAKAVSGKLVIFAWFENKKAVMNWYNSGMHQGIMHIIPGGKTRKPLDYVKDDKSTILCIASVTPSEKPDPKTGMPFSQIAIELYTPVGGGFALGGRFAPSSVKVQGLSEPPAGSAPTDK